MAPVTRSIFFAISTLLAQTLSAQQLTICLDYHCEKTQDIELSEGELSYITELFLTPATSSQQERQKISLTIARFEKIIGRITPTGQDLAENKGEDTLGQLDCIAESLNTQRYLSLLSNNGFIKHHIVSDRQRRVRGLIFDHWSAFVTEKITKQKYAVDSWHYKNGQPAIIQTEADWLSYKAADNKTIP